VSALGLKLVITLKGKTVHEIDLVPIIIALLSMLPTPVEQDAAP
jgi:hypothetical protein